MQIDPTTPLASLVTRTPSASKVLLRHGLDFCCGGQASLADACSSAGLDVAAVQAELQELQATAANAGWDTRPLPDLIQHILDVYHAPLEEDLAQLEAMANKVLAVHLKKDPQRLSQLAEAVRALGNDLRPHVHKEEQVLFPWILGHRSPAPHAPIAVMRNEHEEAGALLESIRKLTDGFTPPRNACATWRNLYARLARFDQELREHIHLENNILFPRALET